MSLPASPSESNGSNRESRFALLVTAVFAVVVFWRIFSHAMWRDEWQAWLLAANSGSLFNLWFGTLRFEGYPALWHTLLWILSSAGLNASSMQVLHACLASAVVYLFNRIAPLPRLQKVLFSFGYFPFFEYAVISRCYALEFLLMFAACALFQDRPRRSLFIGLALATLAQTHVFAVAVAGGFAVAILCDWWIRTRGLPRVSEIRGVAVALVITFAGIGLAFVQAWPPRGPAFEIHIDFLDRVANAFRGAFLAFCPLPLMATETVTHYGLWNSNILDGWIGAQATLGALFCVVAFVVLLRRPAAAALFLSTTVCMLWFFATYIGAAQRHFGHLFYVFLGALCIAPFCAPCPDDWRFLARFRAAVIEAFASRFVVSILILHAVAGAYLCVAEMNGPFSGSKEAAAIISRSVPKDMPVVADIDYAGTSIAGYLGRPVYYIGRRESGTYIIWDEKRTPVSLPPQELVLRLQEYLNAVHRDIVLVVNYPINVGPEVGQLLGRAMPAIVKDEQFWVFRIHADAKLTGRASGSP